MATTQEQQDLDNITQLLSDLTVKLNAVSTSVGDIKTSIINKGVPVPSGTKLVEYDDKISAIETGDKTDYSELLASLSALGTTMDNINGEVIIAPATPPTS